MLAQVMVITHIMVLACFPELKSDYEVELIKLRELDMILILIFDQEGAVLRRADQLWGPRER